MNFPENLKYAKSHEWVKIENGTATIGISDYAQSKLGDLVFINLPEVGDSFSAGDTFGDVESVKSVSDLLCPISGTVTEVNHDLEDAPETMNSDPYGAWIIKMDSVSEDEPLMDAAAYEKFCREKDQ